MYTSSMMDFTKLLRKIVHEDAIEECRRLTENDTHTYICVLPEHIILGIMKVADGLAFNVLQLCHFNLVTLRATLEKAVPLLKQDSTNPKDCFSSVRLSKVLSLAEKEANALSNDCVGTEHFLLACVAEEGSVLQRYFSTANITLDALRLKAKEAQLNLQRRNIAMQAAFGSFFSPFIAKQASATTKPKTSMLTECTVDLTAKAKNKQLEPVIAREKETARLIQVLSRRTKNNPIILGQSGVGKTAIVEGLAEQIVLGKVPTSLSDKKILQLDLSSLVAGAKLRGEFEDRVKRLLKEISDLGNVILFIDEIHTLVGAGAPEGAMDASNLLKRALQQGTLQCIGATTIKEYRKYFEKDMALSRRFGQVMIEEPTIEQAQRMLEGIKDRFEKFHNIIYAQDVIKTVVEYSSRYITDRALPDKAIDVLDEAGARKKIALDTHPELLSQMQKDIDSLKLQKDDFINKQDIKDIDSIKEQVQLLHNRLDSYADYWSHDTYKEKAFVTAQDIKAVLHSMTGIPLEQLESTETVRLLCMEKELSKKVIGQLEAVEAVSGCVRRSSAGISSTKRPLGSFVFLGPTGVGKTHLAKQLAAFLFGTEDAVIRLDMSDYMEKHSASRLVGAPPGYIGYEEGGLLTEKVRNKPYSVILFDEIEKAHSSVLNLLLQILEEGELKDNFGHIVNFRNCIIIMTSNAGAREITGDNRLGFASNTEETISFDYVKDMAMTELKKTFTPEILNRIDEVVVFKPLDSFEISKIADLQLQELQERLYSRGLELEVTSSAKKYLVEHGFDASMGARPMRRLILKQIEEPIATLILKSPSMTSAVVVVSCHKDSLHCILKNVELKTEEFLNQETDFVPYSNAMAQDLMV